LFLSLVAGLRRPQMAVGDVVGTGTDNTGMHPHLRLTANHLPGRNRQGRLAPTEGLGTSSSVD